MRGHLTLLVNDELKVNWEFCKPKWKYPLTYGEKRNYVIEDRPLPCDLARKLYLPRKSYSRHGLFVPDEWQIEPMNSTYYNEITCFCGPVQTGKTMIAEFGAYWGMKIGISGMLGFAIDEKAEEMFTGRYAEMIKCKKNEFLYELWDEKEDSLTKSKLKLKNCTWTSASANGKNSFASTTSPFTIGSEVAKWNIKNYDPVQMLRGRGDSAFGLYDSRKMILESSPFEVGDMLYNQFFRDGSAILQPHYKCPHCGMWQVLSDSQIILRDKELKGRPAKIRELKSDSVYYECFYCGKEITDRQRVEMSKYVVWAMAEINEESFCQKAEAIDSEGNIKTRGVGGKRKGYDIHCYWWNRLVDINFPLYECLARFFETLHNDAQKRTYENETMARWWRRKTGRIEKTYLESRKVEYFQWGEKHCVPDDVLIITLGVDSQDNGFYYSFVGWGAWLSWIILRMSFIKIPRLDSGYEHQVFENFMNNLYVQPLKFRDGTIADFTIGCIDRGGHRAEDVDYICKHFPSRKLFPYVGLKQRYEDRPMIYKSDKGEFYLGQSDAISEDVGKYISGENFLIPMDIEDEYLKQITRQFHQKKISADGQVSTSWVHGYMGPDHCRDSLNLNLAAAKIKGIDKMLLNPQYCETLKKNRNTVCSIQCKQTEVRPTTNKETYKPRSYFNLNGRCW